MRLPKLRILNGRYCNTCTDMTVDSVADRTSGFSTVMYHTPGLRVIFQNFIGHDYSTAHP